MINWFNHRYPYSNLHELNLDWIINTITKLEQVVNNFVTENTIKYADPIQWNITKQYEKNTVVIDPLSGTAYISSKPVPSGIGLNNTDYWSVIFTLDVISANKNITLHDDANNMLATFESNIGDWLLWNGTLYIVTRKIDIGSAYVKDYNISRATVEYFVKLYITELKNLIGNLNSLTTENKTSVVNAINELVTKLDGEIQARSQADTQLQNNISAEAQTRAQADTQLQNNINAEAQTRAQADTQLQNNINAEANYIKSFIPLEGDIIIVGDSYIDGVGATLQTALGYMIAKYANKTVGQHAFLMYQSACGFVTSGNLPSFETIMRNNENIVPVPNNVTCIIIVGGTNDALRGAGTSAVGSALTSISNYISNRYPKAKIMLSSNVVCAGGSSGVVSGYLHLFKNQEKINYIGDLGAFIKKLFISQRNTMSDSIHPNATGYNLCGKQIVDWLNGFSNDYNVYNSAVVSNVDGSLYTYDTHYNFQTLGTQLFNSANFTFNTFGGVQVDHLYIGKTKNQFPFANTASNDIPFNTGESMGLIESTAAGVYKFYPCLFRFNLDADGYVRVYATATVPNEDGFMYSDGVRAFWANMSFNGDLAYIQLRV